MVLGALFGYATDHKYAGDRETHIKVVVIGLLLPTVLMSPVIALTPMVRDPKIDELRQV